jgi:hypothetical protein
VACVSSPCCATVARLFMISSAARVLYSVVETLLQLLVSNVWSDYAFVMPCHHTNRSSGLSPQWAEMGHSVGHIKDLRYPLYGG